MIPITCIIATWIPRHWQIGMSTSGSEWIRMRMSTTWLRRLVVENLQRDMTPEAKIE